MFTASDIFEALREVVDPELGINIVDLGLVYGLQIDGARVRLAIGWRRYGADADPRVRARFAAEAAKLRNGYGAALWAMEKYLQRSNGGVSARIRALRLQIEDEFGGVTRLIDRTVGPVLLWSARRDARAFPAGRALEPQTFVDRRNWT